MTDQIHGHYGNENRKFLSGLYKPKPTEVFMKVNSSIQSLPSKCDLRNYSGPLEIYNQGGLGSCTANAIAAAYKILGLIRYRKTVSISRYLFNNTRHCNRTIDFEYI